MLQKICAAVGATGLGMTLAVSAQAEPLPIEAIERFPALEQVSLSPDGEHIVGLVAAPGQKWPVISVWKTDALDERPIWIPTEEMRFHYVDFLGNEKLIFIAQDTYTYGSYKRWQRKLYISDLDGGDIEEPLRQQGTGRSSGSRDLSFSVFYDDFADRDRFYIESSTFQNQKIYELNTRTGRKRNVAESGEDTFYISGGVNPQTGDLLIKQELEPISGGGYIFKTYIRQDASSPWEYHPALSYDIVDRISMEIQGFDRSPDDLVVVTNKGSEFAEARIYNVDTQTWDAEPLFSVPGHDIASVSFTYPDDGFPEVTGMRISAPGLEQFSVHPYWGPVIDDLKSKFPGEQITVSDARMEDGAGMAIVTIDSMQRPNEYYLFDNGKLIKLGELMPWVDNSTLPRSQWVTYKARDGLTVPAILTLPPDYDKARDGRIPAVVHPHGGPWSRDYMGWDYSGWVPFLATRGVAVLRPQYRGSTGLGMALWKAGDSEWGQKMQDDKDDGAAWMVEQGIADPDKLAIFGYSYGGFAAIAASVRPNSPYQCAIAGAGVSNLDKLANFWGDDRVSRAFQAHTVDGMDPIDNVDKANIPILLYHGDHDRQADTYHSREFYSAMKRANKDVEYVEIENMWHQLPWWPEWHRETLTLIEDYFASDKCNNIISK
jgi:dipeptidyl aminopeptidase/acylaminoacyl peptidase